MPSWELDAPREFACGFSFCPSSVFPPESGSSRAAPSTFVAALSQARLSGEFTAEFLSTLSTVPSGDPITCYSTFVSVHAWSDLSTTGLA
eukprot:345395-Pyramimonas_sp.AAC.1